VEVAKTPEYAGLQPPWEAAKTKQSKDAGRDAAGRL
jgi:hypothetical protein